MSSTCVHKGVSSSCLLEPANILLPLDSAAGSSSTSTSNSRHRTHPKATTISLQSNSSTSPAAESPSSSPTAMNEGYGRRDLRLLYSNNPNACSGSVECFDPIKIITALEPSDLEVLYVAYERPGGIHDGILEVLRVHGVLKGNSDTITTLRSFGVYRIGFNHESSQSHNATLLIVVHPNFKGDSQALVEDLGREIQNGLTLSNGSGTYELYVDLCIPKPSSFRSTRDGNTRRNQQLYYSKVYDEDIPSINASISISGGTSTGSLCCYFMRKGSTQLYALTNCHVVRKKVGGAYLYKSEGKNTEIKVQSPSSMDHEAAMEYARKKLDSFKTFLKKVQDARHEAWKLNFCEDSESDLTFDEKVAKDENLKSQALEATNEVNRLEKAFKELESYNCDLGYVWGTSKVESPGKKRLENSAGQLVGREDSSIILVTKETKHRTCNSHRRTTGYKEELHIGDTYLPSNCDDWKTQFDSIKKLEEYYNADDPPLLKGLSPEPQFDSSGRLTNAKGFFIKTPSARSGFTIGRYNGIRSTLWKEEGDCVSREHAICAVHNKEDQLSVFSRNGDSGSAILDEDNRLFAMMWGGQMHNDIGDLTYVTLIRDVFANCEKICGWEPNSCYLVNSFP